MKPPIKPKPADLVSPPQLSSDILTVRLSPHARQRLQQRATPAMAVDAALAWGRPLRQLNHRTAWFIDASSVRQAARSGIDLSRLQGTAVVQAKDGAILTVIRCQNAQKLKRWLK